MISSCTRPRGRTWTAPRTARRARSPSTPPARAQAVELGAPVVYYSSDYVFTGSKREPYVESDEPAPLSAYGESKLAGEQEVRRGWIVRSSWLFGRSGHNFVRTMLRLAAERDEVTVVDDQRGSPTYTGHLAAGTRDLLERPEGVYTRGRRRLHLGGIRRGDLRGSRPRLPCGASPRPSSGVPRRDRRTRCSAARRTPRGSRTGATACVSACSGSGSLDGHMTRFVVDCGVVLQLASEEYECRTSMSCSLRRSCVHRRSPSAARGRAPSRHVGGGGGGVARPHSGHQDPSARRRRPAAERLEGGGRASLGRDLRRRVRGPHEASRRTRSSRSTRIWRGGLRGFVPTAIEALRA